MIEMQSGSLKKGAAPPPPGLNPGLLIFGTSNVLSHLEMEDFSRELGIPVKLEAAMKLDVFQQKVTCLDPTRDWLVLVHCLGNDARNIALKRKTDSEKASEADEFANQFCDIIEQRILGSAEHICVLVSMLLPRCDFQEKPGMANPNNVRKVINVQITSRLYENPRVSLINSDKALEWGEDVGRLNRLMEGDGYHLTRLGFDLVLATWAEQIRKKMRECNFEPRDSVAANTETVAEMEEEGEELVNGADEEEEEEEEEDSPVDDEDTVPDPFGSYTAPVEIVSPKARTISFSDIKDDLDDDALPNLELVTPVHSLKEQLSSIALAESQTVEDRNKVEHITDEEEEFHDVDDGGFIDDNYCGGDVKDSTVALPSMLSLAASTSPPLSSGHFLEDSYLPPPLVSLEGRSTVEFAFTSAEIVKIAGDFNSWQPQEMEKGSEPQSWRLLMDLPVGQYQYKYQVLGDWVLDTSAGTTVDTEGATNNVILVSNDVI